MGNKVTLPEDFACKPGLPFNPLARVTLAVGLPYLLVNRALINSLLQGGVPQRITFRDPGDIYVFIYLFVCCLVVCLFIYLFIYQEPIKGSLYLPYLALDSTLSPVDVLIERLPQFEEPIRRMFHYQLFLQSLHEN